MLNSPVRRPDHGGSPTHLSRTWPDATVLIEALTHGSREVWQSMLGLDLEPARSSLPATPGHPRWSGCIALSGDWRGAVTVSCLEPMAKLAAASMFGMDANDATAAEIQDAIGEVANMIGGQTKTVLGGTCALGLPVVIEGDAFEATIPHSRTVAQLHFLCDGHPVDVTIVGADTSAGAVSDGVTLTET